MNYIGCGYGGRRGRRRPVCGYLDRTL